MSSAKTYEKMIFDLNKRVAKQTKVDDSETRRIKLLQSVISYLYGFPLFDNNNLGVAEVKSDEGFYRYCRSLGFKQEEAERVMYNQRQTTSKKRRAK